MFEIDKISNIPLYKQIIVDIKKKILQEVLLPGEKLPSIREMAKHLLINPNTVGKAYKILEKENVIKTIKGRGTFINTVDKEIRQENEINNIKKRFNELYIDANYSNITNEELGNWLDEYFTMLNTKF